jgi:hypothetical protein
MFNSWDDVALERTSGSGAIKALGDAAVAGHAAATGGGGGGVPATAAGGGEGAAGARWGGTALYGHCNCRSCSVRSPYCWNTPRRSPNLSYMIYTVTGGVRERVFGGGHWTLTWNSVTVTVSARWLRGRKEVRGLECKNTPCGPTFLLPSMQRGSRRRCSWRNQKIVLFVTGRHWRKFVAIAAEVRTHCGGSSEGLSARDLIWAAYPSRESRRWRLGIVRKEAPLLCTVRHI